MSERLKEHAWKVHRQASTEWHTDGWNALLTSLSAFFVSASAIQYNPIQSDPFKPSYGTNYVTSRGTSN